MVKEFYEAFLEAGASKEKATKAAEVASGFMRPDDETLATKNDIRELKGDIQVLDAKMNMMQWVMGGVGFGIILLVIQTFVR